jgi:thymidylate kinase
MTNGRFIIVDGITGSGKSTILRSVDAWAEECAHRVFRLSEWKDVAPPRFEDVKDHDVFFTYEPTRTWIGAAIRYELSRTDSPYGGEELAHAFALDRQIMYKRLIIPALKAGKTIIQDRGVSTSLVYQPIMEHSVPLETVMDLPGNKLALKHAPHALILTKLPAQMAHDRIKARSDESKGVFAEPSFLKQQEERFAQPWLHELFEARGTTLFELDTSTTLEETNERARSLIDQILKTC